MIFKIQFSGAQQVNFACDSCSFMLNTIASINRPFYRYGGHLEFRGNYGMPRGQMRNN